jgi:mannose-1-phosphate guanylyltransferase
VERGASVAQGAHVGSLVVLADGVQVGEGSSIERSVVLHGSEIGANCRLRDCIIAGGVRIGDGCEITGGAVIGEGVTIGAGNVVSNGARIFPGVNLPDGALKF